MYGSLGYANTTMCHLVRLTLILCSFLPVSYGHAGLLGPSTYEDCVLEGVKTAKTKEAVGAVYAMCKRKFDIPSALPPPLPKQTGQCVVAYDGRKMISVTVKPTGYKSRALKKDGVKVVTVFVPQEMDTTRVENWAERMFIMAMDHCEISF